MKIGEIWTPRKEAKKVIQSMIDRYVKDDYAKHLLSDTNDSDVRIEKLYKLYDGSEIVGFIYLKYQDKGIISHGREDFLEHFEKVY